MIKLTILFTLFGVLSSLKASELLSLTLCSNKSTEINDAVAEAPLIQLKIGITTEKNKDRIKEIYSYYVKEGKKIKHGVLYRWNITDLKQTFEMEEYDHGKLVSSQKEVEITKGYKEN